MKGLVDFISESRGGFDWDDESNSEGKIELTTSVPTHGGREELSVDWELELLSQDSDIYYVKATVVRTEMPRKFKKGWYIEFELYKDTKITDVEYDLMQAIEDERMSAWSSGH